MEALKEEKCDSWDWNYGLSPKFNIQHSKRFPIGEIDVGLFVEKGHFTGFKIFGDFFGKEPLETLENLLIDVKYDKTEISKKVIGVKIEDYFGNVSASEFIELLFSTDE